MGGVRLMARNTFAIKIYGQSSGTEISGSIFLDFAFFTVF
jgi:hypothetical protein